MTVFRLNTEFYSINLHIQSKCGHSSDQIMKGLMVPNEFLIQMIDSKSSFKIQNSKNFFNMTLINQSKMSIFVRLFKEVWKSFNSRLNYGIGITNNILYDAFCEKQCERFHSSFCVFSCSSWDSKLLQMFSAFFLFILMVNGIPADICGFLGAAVLELIISWRGKAA